MQDKPDSDHERPAIAGSDRERPAIAGQALDERSTALLKRTWHDWAKSRWREIVLSLGLTGVVAATSGAYPFIIKYAFNGLGPGRVELLWYVVAAIIAVTVLRATFLYLQTVVSSRAVLGMTVAMQKAVYGHLLRSDYARIARDTPGHLVSRLTNDIASVQTASLAILNTSIRDALTVVAVVASMSYLDWSLTLAVVALYPLAAWPIASIGQRLRQAEFCRARAKDLENRHHDDLALHGL